MGGASLKGFKENSKTVFWSLLACACFGGSDTLAGYRSSEFGESGLFASTGSTGQGGNIGLKADTLIVSNKAEITASTSSEGNAGEINVFTNQLR